MMTTIANMPPSDINFPQHSSWQLEAYSLYPGGDSCVSSVLLTRLAKIAHAGK